MTRFLINTTEELKNSLTYIAKERGQTLNGLIRQILWEWLEKEQGGK